MSVLAPRRLKVCARQIMANVVWQENRKMKAAINRRHNRLTAAQKDRLELLLHSETVAGELRAKVTVFKHLWETDDQLPDDVYEHDRHNHPQISAK